jgi:glycosyltransferase involved in cell wall biosynthesis
MSADRNGEALVEPAVGPSINRRRIAGGRAERVSQNGHAHGAAPERSRPKLSIIMPVFNEQQTIRRVVSNILSTDFPCEVELIVVNDGSSDATGEILGTFVGHGRLTVLTHPRNLGKGAALRTGAMTAAGTHLVPFDSDLEYEPRDLTAMLDPVLKGRCEVVYGVRLFGVNTRYQSYAHAMGNRALTLFANVLFGAYISDMHTCLKLLPVPLFNELELAENGFGLDTELTAKLLRNGVRPFEVPVTYHSRSAEQGKKLTWRHGVECVNVLIRERARPRRTPLSPGPFDRASGAGADTGGSNAHEALSASGYSAG